MTLDDLNERLMAEVRSLVSPLGLRARADGTTVIVDVLRCDGSVMWPDYAQGPDELLAVLAAEQRYLVEEEGRGAVSGATYLDKARERLRRAAEAGHAT